MNQSKNAGKSAEAVILEKNEQVPILIPRGTGKTVLVFISF